MRSFETYIEEVRARAGEAMERRGKRRRAVAAVCAVVLPCILIAVSLPVLARVTDTPPDVDVTVPDGTSVENITTAEPTGTPVGPGMAGEPTYFQSISSLGAVVVRWGELDIEADGTVMYILNDSPDCDYVAAKVEFVKFFDVMSYDPLYTTGAAGFRQAEMSKFEYIFIPRSYLGVISEGDEALVFIDEYRSIDCKRYCLISDHGREIMCGMLMFRDGRLEIPELPEGVETPDYMYVLEDANRFLHERGMDDVIFGAGLTVDELARFFEAAGYLYENTVWGGCIVEE